MIKVSITLGVLMTCLTICGVMVLIIKTHYSRVQEEEAKETKAEAAPLSRPQYRMDALPIFNMN